MPDTLSMLPDWLTTLIRPKPVPILTAIFIAPAAGKPMQSLTTAQAVQDRGLAGDRYHDNTGHWQLIEGCQVTLITTAELAQAQKKTGIDLGNGSHRRNLVVDGIKPGKLTGKRFRIGTALFAWEKPRPPCGYIDRVSGAGIGRALSHNSGICVRVIESGELRVGNPVESIVPLQNALLTSITL